MLQYLKTKTITALALVLVPENHKNSLWPIFTVPENHENSRTGPRVTVPENHENAGPGPG